jgi:hypothetical protein
VNQANPEHIMAASIAIIRTREDAAGLGRNATQYAIEELARRAGVRRDIYSSWYIDFAKQDFVHVFVQPGTGKRIRFPRVAAITWNQFQKGVFHTSTAGWLPGTQHKDELTCDFKIPFSSSSQVELGPLFVADSPDCFTCSVDLLSSIALTLGRFEETLPLQRDLHGRFPASSSIASRDGFLHRPIVDEYGLALEQVLAILLPGWRRPERHLRVKLSHDVDEIGIPFSFRSTAAKTLKHGRPLSTLRDLVAPALGIDTTYQVHLKRLVQLSIERKLDSAIYWKTSKPGPYDTGYDLSDPRILKLIYALTMNGVEMGIHPSYATFRSPERLRSEVDQLKALLGRQKLGGRQDYLRWSPQSWIDWDSLGLAYDCSVGFADYIGFRAGTCIPYRPWLLSQQRKADLLEIPLLAMDSTLQGYMNLKPKHALTLLRDLVDRCRAVGGVFTLAWHNTRIMNSEYAATYRCLLDELAGSPKYDWISASV